jgi:hypothetical protein
MPTATAPLLRTALDGLDPLCVERRAAPRARVAWRVEVRCGTEELVAHSTDVSIGGMFLDTADSLPIGASLLLAFAVGAGDTRQVVVAEALVVRRIAADDVQRRGRLPGVGIAFTRFLVGEEAFAETLRILLGGPVHRSSDDSRERSHPTRIDGLFLAAVAEWADPSPPEGTTGTSSATSGEVSSGMAVGHDAPAPTPPEQLSPFPSRALALCGATAVALLALFVGLLL